MRFGIIRWSGGAYSWKPELVEATDDNKKEAIDHIQTKVDYRSAPKKGSEPGGTRHDLALAEAFKLHPAGGSIYMLTDGNATISQDGGGLSPIAPETIFGVAESGQKTLSKRAKLHVIYYLNGKEKADERNMLMNLAARNSGQFRKVEAEGRQQ